jgi:hypothetical protein
MKGKRGETYAVVNWLVQMAGVTLNFRLLI